MADDQASVRLNSKARLRSCADSKTDPSRALQPGAAAAGTEEYFRSFFENSPNDLFVLDVRPDGLFVFEHVNATLLKSTGYAYDMLVGKTPEAALTPANSEKLRRWYSTCVATRQPVEYDVTAVTPRGEMVRHTILVPITDADGTVRKILGTTANVTAQRHTERQARDRARELAELNERLRQERLLSELIIENTAEGIIVIDTGLRHLVWNAGMERINGLPRSAVLGRTVFEVFPHLLDHPVGQAWRDALGGQRTESRDRRYFSPVRNAEIVYDADHTPLYDHAGGIVGAICIVRETTERHRIEEMLRQSQKLEAIAQLTGGVAHDFNNLLTGVIGCLEMITLREQDRRLVRLAETALRSAQRGAQLTGKLLAFARRQPLKPVVADVNQLLLEIEVLLRRAAGEAIEIKISTAPDAALCEIDSAQFEAAALNLVMNARDAMPRGGRVELAIRSVEIRDAVAGLDLRPGSYVALSVTDDGHGMAPEVANRAFEPFYTTKEVGKGSGLGLSMVYGFVKQLGGDAHIDSAPEAGTCVTLYLPCAISPMASAVPVVPDSRPDAGRGSILLVEDDADVRSVSIAMLEDLGYRVLIAADGNEALQLIRSREPIDLLFTDIVMPGGISGAALARQAQQLRPGLRVLLTTGYPGPETANEFAVIMKPFRIADLARVIAEALNT